MGKLNQICQTVWRNVSTYSNLIRKKVGPILPISKIINSTYKLQTEYNKQYNSAEGFTRSSLADFPALV